jgi:hypothetical protein
MPKKHKVFSPTKLVSTPPKGKPLVKDTQLIQDLDKNIIIKQWP